MSRAAGKVVGVGAFRGAEGVPGVAGMSDKDYADLVAHPDVNGAKGNGKSRAVPLEAVPAATRDQVVAEMNREYAVVLLGGSTLVLREGTGPDGRPEFRLLSTDAFHEWNRPRKVFVGDKAVPASRLWLASDGRRQFDRLEFDPSETVPESTYNLWKGFAVDPAPPGSPAPERFLAHVADVVCSGDEALFAWVMGWFAQMVQRPTEKLGTSLVLRGAQGTGKSVVGETVGSLLGQHYALASDPRYIIGRFNYHLANCLLLQLDEATWGGDHQAAGKLKDLVTGHWQFIERKGHEPIRVRNYVRLLVTGNNAWLVPAGVEERRFAVIDVADTRMQDHAHFRALHEEMWNGGRARLLRYLLDYNCADVPLRQVPSTGALLEQKVASLAPEQQWWLDILTRGALPGDRDGDGRVECAHLYTHYIERVQRMGVNRRSSETQCGLLLGRMAPGVEKKRVTLADGRRAWVYAFPPLAECRTHFARVIGDLPTDGSSEWQPDSS